MRLSRKSPGLDLVQNLPRQPNEDIRPEIVRTESSGIQCIRRFSKLVTGDFPRKITGAVHVCRLKAQANGDKSRRFHKTGEIG